ncbi:hypothetical protein K4749_23685 [Streptomyces sp. TRM72054]|uniref:hypothetical protein n=1 Tax=Streptomyces sp. TRM72054 TaxID=2870562 RepID=UPI001C8B1161|nr:hypothetical protein [Streptomyces sp. TRM72054]MBX9396511.1 hypothetical protein [Streptomyces sp. TRM72054]
MLLRDMWQQLPGGTRSEFLRRVAEGDWWTLRVGESEADCWEAMRPLVFAEADYYRFAELAAGVLRCALLSCRRRAGTAGELYRALNDDRDFRLLGPSQRLSASALLRMARPDALLVGGTPWFIELNIGPNIYGVPDLEQRGAAFARCWPDGRLAEPPSTLHAGAAVLADAAPASRGARRRALIPAWQATSGIAARLGSTGALHRYLQPAAEAAKAVGLDARVADLSQVRGDAGGLWVGGDRIDVVFNQFSSLVVADSRSLDALRDAALSGTVRLFVPEASCLVSAKQVLAWMHEDLELFDPAERRLIIGHVPWTAWLGPQQSPRRRQHLLAQAVRHRVHLVAKPSCGHGGVGFVAGHQVDDEQWLELLTNQSSEHTLVLQRRLVPDSTWMPFRSSDGVCEEARVPYVVSPFLLNRHAAGAHVRHPGPGTTPHIAPVNAAAGAVSNTILLLPQGEPVSKRQGSARAACPRQVPGRSVQLVSRETRLWGG